MKCPRLFIILCFAVSLVSLPEARGAVRIVAIFAKTGGAADFDRPVWRALRFTVNKINAGGGARSGGFDLIELDTGSTAIGARNAAREAVALKAAVVIGASWSSQSLAMAPVLQKAGIPMISPGSTHPDLTRMGPYIFRMTNSDTRLASVLAGFARRSLNARSAVILTNNDNKYSISMATLFRSFFIGQGGEVLDEKDYLPGLTDYGELLQSVKDIEPDLIFTPGYSKDAGAIVKKAHDIGIDAHMMGGDAWGEGMYPYAGDALHGNHYIVSWDPVLFSQTDNRYEDFVQAFGKPENAVMPLIHDTVILVEDAVSRAGSVGPEEIRNAISETSDLTGMTGKIIFNHLGDRIMPYLIFRFENGESVPVDVISPIKLALLSHFVTVKPRFFTTDPFQKTADFAVSEINLAGGVQGRPVELIVFDSRKSALDSRAAARLALGVGVDAAIGAIWSSHSLAMAPLFQEAGTVMISPMSSHPDVTRTGDYIFRACFTDSFQGAVMAEFALDSLNAKTAVVLTNTDRKYSISLSEYFIERYKGRGGDLLWRGDFSGESVQYENVLTRAKDLNPDVIFAPTGSLEGGLLIKQARKLGLKATFLCGDGWSNAIYDYAGPAAEGGYYVSSWHKDIPFAASKRFVSAFTAAGGDLSKWEQGQVMIYEAIMLFAAGARAAVCPESNCLRDALLGLQGFQGISGPVRFDHRGDPRKAAVILKLTGGSSVFHDIVSFPEAP